MQLLNVIIHMNQEHNLGSEVNDLLYDFHNFKIGKTTNWSTPTHSFQNDLQVDLFSIMLSNMSRSVETKYNVMFSVWFDLIRVRY